MTGLAPARRAWIEAALGAAVEGARPIGQGASRATWLVELADREPVVLREETGQGPMAGTALDLAREALVYRALGPTGLPVPAVLSVADDGTALLLAHARGEASWKGLDEDAIRAVSADLGRCLAELHRLDPAALELGPLAADDDLEVWASIAATRAPAPATPIAAVALPWLAARVQDHVSPRSLCHGDAGAGNLLHEGGAVTALLDWEFAHLDDPHDDLAWVAVRNQVQRRPLDVGAVFRAWQLGTGRTIDPARLEHHRALVLTRMLISCDAALAWAGDGEPPMVQAMLRPYLGLALVEALRRAGADGLPLEQLAAEARALWEGRPIAQVLDDPTDLDDLGGPW